VKKISILLK